MELPITDEQKEYARNLADKVIAHAAAIPCYNCHDRKAENVLGFIGEVVLCDYLQQPRPRVGDVSAFDHIINGKKVNLKISSYYGPNMYLKVRSGYAKVDFDGYLLGHIPRSFDRLYVLAYISKEEFNLKKVVRNFGYYDTDTININDMRKISYIGLPLKEAKE
jgi:hypothetical protein